MSRPSLSIVPLVLGFVVSSLAAAYLIWKVDLAAVGRALAQANWLRLSLIALLYAVGVATHGLRAKVLLRTLAPNAGWLMLTRSRLVALVANNLLPFRAGELLRVTYLHRELGLPIASGVGITAVERFCDVVLTFAVFSLALGHLGIPVETVWLIAGLIGVLFLAGVFAVWFAPQLQPRLPRRIASFIEQGRSALVAFRGAELPLLAVNLAYIAFGYLWWWGLFWAFSLEVPIYTPSVVLGFLAFGTAFPAAPASVGTYHLFATSALTACGVAPELALAVATAAHGLSVAFESLLGVPVLPWVFTYRGKVDEPKG